MSVTATTSTHSQPCIPLLAGAWPSPETRLYIHDHAGVWSYRGHMECGRETFILIESYGRSASLWAHTEWRVVRIERLYSRAADAEKAEQKADAS